MGIMNRKMVASLAAVAMSWTGMVGLVRPSSDDVVAAAPASPTDESKVPHYFGPYPNWANSPQVLANAIVEITPVSGDPGSGATATATVDPKLGGITAVSITSPGSGYLVAPDVAITAPGLAPPPTAAVATAQISPGVVTSIAVDETGFGFTAPAVTITAQPVDPGSGATATASGGVDNVSVIDGGVYEIQPIVEFSLPDLPGGVQATGTATMVSLDPAAVPPTFVITEVTVVEAGTGYTAAPTVTIWDAQANQLAPTPAVTEATIGIAQIDITSGGVGFIATPTVTINDTVGVADKGASATATVAVAGAVTAITVTDPGAGYLTPGIRKFVDQLPGLTAAGANNLGNYIPLAVPDTTTYPGSDYYEIALVQYRQQFHSDLPATLLRGYVQLSTSVVPGIAVPLTNANLDPAIAPSPALLPDGTQAIGVDQPRYLGPTIVAAKDRPVRILFRNLLPTGEPGNLFLPVDTSLMGSGMGPNAVVLDPNTNIPLEGAADEGTVLDAVRNPMCGESPKPSECFAETRATLHLHGGVTPWISDGTPHQWITPAGENTDYPEGVSVSDVPDMPDPGPGAQTFFYTNQQSARLMFYHDHAWGITRLNVYAGEAAGYLVTDPMEQSLIGTGGALAGLGVGTPLIVQDKTFVPSADTMAKADPTWNYDKWGGEGNLWTPHVYMPAQNPGDPSGMSGFGRWMYGPWFWPPAKDAKYPPIDNPYFDPACDPEIGQTDPITGLPTDLPCEPALIPSTPNISVGMEAFNDTPMVNGTVYPTTTVDPKTYRFRVLNAANDRFWNLSWYVADPRTGTLTEVALQPGRARGGSDRPSGVADTRHDVEPQGPELDSDRHRRWLSAGSRRRSGPADHLDHRPDPLRRRQRRSALAVASTGRACRRDRRLLPIPWQDPDHVQRRPRRLPGSRPWLRLLHRRPRHVARRRPDHPARIRPQHPHHHAGQGVEHGTRDRLRPAQHHQRPDGCTRRRVRPQGGWQRRVRIFDGPDHRRPGCIQLGLRFELRVERLVQQPNQPDREVRRICPDRGAGQRCPEIQIPSSSRIRRPGDRSRQPRGAQAATGDPFQPKGMHDEMNSANFDEWGRMTANLGLEAPGATPLLQNIILYPYVNPPTEILDSNGLPSALDVTPISSAADGTQIWKITHNGVRYPPDPLPSVRRANPQPGHLGQRHHPARANRSSVGRTRADQSVGRHDRRPTADRADPPVRRPRQQPAAQPGDASPCGGRLERRCPRSRLRRHRRHGCTHDHPDRQRDAWTSTGSTSSTATSSAMRKWT